MSKRLNEVMTRYMDKEGKAGKLKLALAICRGERMIDRYWNGESTPSRDTAFKLALQCGLNEGEARELASEFPISGRKAG